MFVGVEGGSYNDDIVAFSSEFSDSVEGSERVQMVSLAVAFEENDVSWRLGLEVGVAFVVGGVHLEGLSCGGFCGFEFEWGFGEFVGFV